MKTLKTYLTEGIDWVTTSTIDVGTHKEENLDFLKNCNCQVEVSDDDLILRPINKSQCIKIDSNNINNFLQYCKQYSIIRSETSIDIYVKEDKIDFDEIIFELQHSYFSIHMNKTKLEIKNLDVNCLFLRVIEPSDSPCDVIYKNCDLKVGSSIISDYSVPKFIKSKLQLTSRGDFSITGKYTSHSIWSKLFNEPEKYIKLLDDIPSQIDTINVNDEQKGFYSYDIYRKSNGFYKTDDFYKTKFKNSEWVIAYNIDRHKKNFGHWGHWW